MPPQNGTAPRILDLVCPNCGTTSPAPYSDHGDCARCSYPILRPEHLKAQAVLDWQRRPLPRSTGEAA